MDFTQQITTALQERLDVGLAFPVVFQMNQATVDMFVNSVFTALHEKILTVMKEAGEQYVAANDALGLSLHLMRAGIKLPADMLLSITRDIIKFSRKTAKWIMHTGDGIPGQRGGLWYCKMYVNPYQEEKEEANA